MDEILYKLSKSKFRSSFKLNNKLKEYVIDKGYNKIEEHAYDFINKRLKPEIIENDGKIIPKDIMMRFLLWWYYGYDNAFRFNNSPRHSVGLGGNISLSGII